MAPGGFGSANRSKVRLLNLLGHGEVDLLVVVIRPSLSNGRLANGLQEALAALIIVDSSCSSTAVPLQMAALRAAVGATVPLQILGVEPGLPQSR